MLISFSKLFRSFKYAFKGAVYVLQNEQNFRIQLLAALVVVALMIIFPLPEWQVIILLMLIGSVLVLEIVNTIFEKIADMLQPKIHHYVAIIKDLMAAAVFLTSVGALIIGLIIFVPYFIDFFGS